VTDQTAMDRGARAEALLLRFAAEAHRRKWDYDRGVDDDGVPIKSEAFDALHRLGEEMRVELEKLRAAAPAVQAPAADRAAAPVCKFDEGCHRVVACEPGCGTSPAADRATPSRRAGLRDEIAAAIWERQNPGRRWADCEHPWGADAEEDADAIMPVLYREWPWLRAEAEDTAPAEPATDRAAQRDRIAEAVDSLQGTAHHLPPETRQRVIEAVAGAVLPALTARAALRGAADWFDADERSVARMFGHQVAAELRRMADEAQPAAGCPQCGDTGACNGGPCPLRPADEAQPTEALPPSPRCAHCTHPKRDHDGHADHRAKFSPLVTGDPWCHACNTECDYAPAKSCAHCGQPISRVIGTLTTWWVHAPGGNTVCNPQHAANSPRATPEAAGAQQDGPQ
jgi:hypothetical protein